MDISVRIVILPAVYCIIAILLNLSYAQYTELFFNGMDEDTGWVVSGNVYFGTLHCLIGGCVYLDQGESITWNGISTDGYHSIQLKAVIKKLYFQTGDYCVVSYSVEGANFTPLKIYVQDNESITSNDTLTRSRDANNQNGISIRFEMMSAVGSGYCFVDEVMVALFHISETMET